MEQYILEKVLNENNAGLILTMDCEGPIFDKNLKNNVLNLERFLELATKNEIYTILFITPYFADMLERLNLIDKIKNEYKVIFGLHIHPNNLPEEIVRECPFVREDIDNLSYYSLEEQKIIIRESMKYLSKKSISPIEIFRGGYFSMNDDTAKALVEITNIRWESHNIYRQQYNVTKPLLKSLPVYAFDKELEFRLEYFNTEKLVEMADEASKNNTRIVGITHSYLLDDNDLHYKRDGIKDSINSRLQAILGKSKTQDPTPGHP